MVAAVSSVARRPDQPPGVTACRPRSRGSRTEGRPAVAARTPDSRSRDGGRATTGRGRSSGDGIGGMPGRYGCASSAGLSWGVGQGRAGVEHGAHVGAQEAGAGEGAGRDREAGPCLRDLTLDVL